MIHQVNCCHNPTELSNSRVLNRSGGNKDMESLFSFWSSRFVSRVFFVSYSLHVDCRASSGNCRRTKFDVFHTSGILIDLRLNTTKNAQDIFQCEATVIFLYYYELESASHNSHGRPLGGDIKWLSSLMETFKVCKVCSKVLKITLIFYWNSIRKVCKV